MNRCRGDMYGHSSSTRVHIASDFHHIRYVFGFVSPLVFFIWFLHSLCMCQHDNFAVQANCHLGLEYDWKYSYFSVQLYCVKCSHFCVFHILINLLLFNVPG